MTRSLEVGPSCEEGKGDSGVSNFLAAVPKRKPRTLRTASRFHDQQSLKRRQELNKAREAVV
jgi:hypothetical protein